MRHRHVEPVRHTEDRGRLRGPLAVGPEARPVGGVQGDDGVAVVRQVHRDVALARRLGLQQEHVVRLAGQRPRQRRGRADVAQHRRVHDLRGEQAYAARHRRAHERQRVGRVADADEGDGGRRDRSYQAQPHGRDDAEGPLAADEQPGEVVAGVVLRQPAEVADHRAVGQHRLDPHHLRPRHAVHAHPDPARVRADRAADGRAVAGREVDAVLPAGGLHVPVQVGEDDAGTRRDLAGEVVDGVEPGEPPGGEDHDRRSRRPRDRAADEPGVAALRQDRHTGCRARPDHRRDLGRVGRTDHGDRRTGEAPRPVDGVRRDEVRLDEHVRRTDRRAQRLDEPGSPPDDPR